MRLICVERGDLGFKVFSHPAAIDFDLLENIHASGLRRKIAFANRKPPDWLHRLETLVDPFDGLPD